MCCHHPTQFNSVTCVVTILHNSTASHVLSPSCTIQQRHMCSHHPTQFISVTCVVTILHNSTVSHVLSPSYTIPHVKIENICRALVTTISRRRFIFLHCPPEHRRCCISPLVDISAQLSPPSGRGRRYSWRRFGRRRKVSIFRPTLVVKCHINSFAMSSHSAI